MPVIRLLFMRTQSGELPCVVGVRKGGGRGLEHVVTFTPPAGSPFEHLSRSDLVNPGADPHRFQSVRFFIINIFLILKKLIDYCFAMKDVQKKKKIKTKKYLKS